MDKADTIIITPGYQPDIAWWLEHNIHRVNHYLKLPGHLHAMEEGQDTGDDLLALMKQVIKPQDQRSAETYNNVITRAHETLARWQKQTDWADEDIIERAGITEAMARKPLASYETRVLILCNESDLPHIADTVNLYVGEHYPELMSDPIIHHDGTEHRERLGYNNWWWGTRLPPA